MEIIREQRTEIRVRYWLEFRDTTIPGAGFSFPCNEQGYPQDLLPCAWRNYRECLANPCRYTPVNDGKPVVDEYTVWYPAAIRCVCGVEVELWDTWCSTCTKCGRDYNGSGQLLAPRSQWGEETGETLTEMWPHPGEDF